MIQASVQSSPQITASVSGGTVSATVSGGFGPAGPAGMTTISAAGDVAFSGAADGDVIRYSSGKWRNYQEQNLVDGGNW